MKTAIELPAIRQVFGESIGQSTGLSWDSDVHNAKVWFPLPEDRDYFWGCFGKPPASALDLYTEDGKSLALTVLCGPEERSQCKSTECLLVYLHQTGLGDRDLKHWLAERATKGAPTFFLRIFRSAYLKQAPGEDDPIRPLNAHVVNSFGGRPCLVLDRDLEFLREWFSGVVWYTHLHSMNSRCSRGLTDLRFESDRFLHKYGTIPVKPITTETSLLEALRIRTGARELRTKIHDLEARRRTCTRCIQDTEGVMSVLAERIYRRTGKAVFGDDFRPYEGQNIHARLQTLMPHLRSFSGKLLNSEFTSLRDIGTTLGTSLEDRPPVLAIAGVFSSGKTTLLNTLLFGQGSVGYFRASPVPNTAIVSEVSFAREDEREEVLFHYRDAVDHQLVRLGNYGMPICSLFESGDEAGKKHALLSLIDRNILKSPFFLCELERSVARGGMGGKRESEQKEVAVQTKADCRRLIENLEAILAEGFHKFDPQHRDFKVREIYLSAQVDKNLIARKLTDEFPIKIDLTQADGWTKFQGDGQEKEPYVETAAPSFVVRTAHVKLKIPFLQLTTLADTPGTGAVNDRHEEVAHQYLDRAEAFIVLLPTNAPDSMRVRELLEKIHQVAKRFDSGNPLESVRNIAFLVNVFDGSDEEKAIQKVVDFEEKIREQFRLPQQWWKHAPLPTARNLFAVNLKRLEQGHNPERLMGYPSLVPLRKWMETLFRSGGYDQRIRRFVSALEPTWNVSRANIEQRISDLTEQKTQEDILKHNQQIDSLDRLIATTLQRLKRDALQALEDFETDFFSGKTSSKSELDTFLNDFVSRASGLNQEDVSNRKGRFMSLFRLANTELDHFRDREVAAFWAEEVRHELETLGVMPPALSPPHKSGGAGSWDIKDSLNIQVVESKFDEIVRNWPWAITNWFTGKRTRLAGELQSFCDSKFKERWDPLKTYIDQCKCFVDGGTKEAESRIRDRQRELRSAYDNAEAAENTRRLEQLQKELQGFRQLDRERRELVDGLNQILNGQ